MTQSNKTNIIDPTVAAVPNIFPIVVNGYKINVLEGDSTFKFSVETKTVGLNGAGPTIVKFTRLSDARRWTRLN